MKRHNFRARRANKMSKMNKTTKEKETGIRARLMQAFFVVTAMTSVAGVLGAIALFIISARYENALANYGFSQGDIGKAMTAFAEARSSLRGAIGYDEGSEIEHMMSVYYEEKELFNEYIAIVEHSMVTDAGHEAYEDIMNKLEGYWELSDEILEYGSVTDREICAKAQERAVNELAPRFTEVYEAMLHLMDVNVEKGDDTHNILTVAKVILTLAILLIIVVSVMLAVRRGVRISKGIEKPLNELAERLKTFAEGDLSSPFPEYDTQDEILDMLTATKNMAENLNLIISDVEVLLSEMAGGNYTVETEMEEKYVGQFANLIQSISKMNTQIDATLRNVQDASAQVRAGAENLAESAQDLAEGATEQAGTVEELQATINGVTVTIEKTAEDLLQSYHDAKNYADAAHVGRGEMSAMVAAMGRISEASQKIETIISDIEDIASQTNLLSLNAAIEAARAGEAGKGFAVVAEQIRSLAEQSAKSAVDTRDLIEDTLKEIEDGSNAAERVSESMGKVIKGMEEIAESSKVLSQQSEQQARAMEEVDKAVGQISEVVQSNSAAAQECSATSQELSAQSETLNELTSRFVLRNR